MPSWSLLHSGNRDSGTGNSVVGQPVGAAAGGDLLGIGDLLPGWKLYTIQYLLDGRGCFTRAILAGERREFTFVNGIQDPFSD